MIAEIKYLKYQHMFGRMLALCQLHGPEGKIMEGSLAQVLTHCDTENIKISNAQQVLSDLVRKGGFAA
jgi:hypothetical protein